MSTALLVMWLWAAQGMSCEAGTAPCLYHTAPADSVIFSQNADVWIKIPAEGEVLFVLCNDCYYAEWPRWVIYPGELAYLVPSLKLAVPKQLEREGGR